MVQDHNFSIKLPLRLVQNLVHLIQLHHIFVHFDQRLFIDIWLFPIINDFTIVVEYSINRDGIIAVLVQKLYFIDVRCLRTGEICGLPILNSFRPCVR